MNDGRIVAVGDSALAIQFDERIDPEVNARVMACAHAVAARRLDGVRDVVPAFRSVTVYFDPLATDLERLGRLLRDAAPSGQSWGPPSGGPVPGQRTVEIPVCYDPEFAPDIEDVCRTADLGADEVVARHTSPEYRVYMLGFVPGFAYLGTVDPRIATPRRAVPRTAVARGSVGIAGSQTGVYPRQVAGGWNIIGRTPLSMVTLDADRPTRLAPGDRVRFRAIGRAEFDRLQEPHP